MLCLDDGNVMQKEAKGERIALVMPPQMEDDVSLTRLIMAVHLSRVGTQQLLLKLYSGTAASCRTPRKIFGCWVVRGYFRARP
jgi:hypothetical protein